MPMRQEFKATEDDGGTHFICQVPAAGESPALWAWKAPQASELFSPNNNPRIPRGTEPGSLYLTFTGILCRTLPFHIVTLGPPSDSGH